MLGNVRFRVEYDDEGVDFLRVLGTALSGGDHVAYAIAEEQQRAGNLRAGKIVRVRRERPGEWTHDS
jgi:hypothetical protein